MAKPTKLFGFTSVTYPPAEPDNTRKASGYNVDDVLPAPELNWWLVALKEWIDEYLNVIEGEELSWSVIQNFLAGVRVGGALVADLAKALTPRLNLWAAANATSHRTALLSTGLGGALSVVVYGYTTTNLGYVVEVAINATFDGSVWNRTAGSTDSALLRLGFDKTLRWAWRDDGAADGWADSYGGSAGAGTGWTTIFSADSSGLGALTLNSTGLASVGSLLVVGAAAISSITAALLTLSADLLVTDDLSVGGDANVTGDVNVTNDVDCAGTVHADDGITSDGNIHVVDGTFDGEVVAGSGIYTLEPIFSWEAFDTGPVNGSFMPTLSTSAGSRLYRLRAGAVLRAQIWASGSASEDVIATIKGSSSGTLGTVRLTSGDQHQTASFGAGDYISGEYVYVELTVDGAAMLSTPRDFGVSLEMVG